jgi:hypothetical protein
MMSSRTRHWLLGAVGGVLLASLAACGGSDADEDTAATHNESGETQESAAMPVQDSAFGDMVGTMDRARGVEKTQMEHKEAVDRAIDQNAGAAPAE